MTTPTVNPTPRAPLKDHKPKNEANKNDKSAKSGESLRSKDEMMQKTQPAAAVVTERDGAKAPPVGDQHKKDIKR